MAELKCSAQLHLLVVPSRQTEVQPLSMLQPFAMFAKVISRLRGTHSHSHNRHEPTYICMCVFAQSYILQSSQITVSKQTKYEMARSSAQECGGGVHVRNGIRGVSSKSRAYKCMHTPTVVRNVAFFVCLAKIKFTVAIKAHKIGTLPYARARYIA